MKKIILSLLLVSALVIFVGCGGGEPEEEEVTPENDVVEEYDGDSDAEYDYDDGVEHDNDWFVAELDAPGTFTHSLSGIEFIADESWEVENQVEGSIFIVTQNAGIAINILGTFDVDPESSDLLDNLNIIFRTMLQDHFGGEDVDIQQLNAGEKGHAVLRATYTLSYETTVYPGIGFIVSNGDQFVLLSGIFGFQDAGLRDDYFEFVSSIRFE